MSHKDPTTTVLPLNLYLSLKIETSRVRFNRVFLITQSVFPSLDRVLSLAIAEKRHEAFAEPEPEFRPFGSSPAMHDQLGEPSRTCVSSQRASDAPLGELSSLRHASNGQRVQLTRD
jgi:hypothetical protein